MTTTKSFPTLDVLGTLTGRLMRDGGIGGIYEVCNFMTGESVYTHQLPRICREAGPVLLSAHPLLAEAVGEADQVNPDTVAHWASVWLERYGEEIEVPRMNADQHERIDPLSELAEKFHPDKIIVLKVGEGQ